MRRVASWTFGGDWLDIERRILIGMKRNEGSDLMLERASRSLVRISNDAQQLFDKNEMASEIHVVWEFV